MASILLLPPGPDSDIFTLKADEQAENFCSHSVHRLPSVSPHSRVKYATSSVASKMSSDIDFPSKSLLGNLTQRG